MRPSPKGPILEALFWIAFAASAYALTFQFDEPLLQYRYGAAGWPRVLIIGVALFATAQMVSSLRRYRRGEEKVEEAPSAKVAGCRDEEATGVVVYLKRISAFVMPLVYLFLLPRMGYYLITPFFLAGYMAILGERRAIHLVGTTLLIFVMTLLTFTELLFVPLPVGNWPGFYEINSLFLSLIK